MKIDNLEYPIVAFSNDGSTHFARSQNELTTCSQLAYKSGYYSRMEIIDSSGNMFRIKEALKKETIKFSLFLNHIIKVDLIFDEQTNKISFSDFQKRIKAGLTEDNIPDNADVQNSAVQTEHRDSSAKIKQTLISLSNKYHTSHRR